MSDVDEITALVCSYARLLDRGDVDGVSALFAHSTWRSLPQGSVLRGSAEIRPIYEKLLAPGHTTSKHLLTNLSVDVDASALTATSHCYWTVLQNAPGGHIEIHLSGHYTDAFEKTDGVWRFADRLITTDLINNPSTPLA